MILLQPKALKKKKSYFWPQIFTLFKKKKKYIGKNILISMGAIDSNNITLKALKILIELIEKKEQMLENYKVIIVVGKFYKNFVSLKNTISKYEKVSLFNNIKDMSKIYKKTYIAIGAPGFSQIERLEYGIPSLLIAQNNLHKSLLREWQKSGCAISSSIINKNKFINDLKNLLESSKQINKIKKK